VQALAFHPGLLRRAGDVPLVRAEEDGEVVPGDAVAREVHGFPVPHPGEQLPGDGALLLARDLVRQVLLPVLPERRVEGVVQLARGIVGRVQQLDVLRGGGLAARAVPESKPPASIASPRSSLVARTRTAGCRGLELTRSRR